MKTTKKEMRGYCIEILQGIYIIRNMLEDFVRNSPRNNSVEDKNFKDSCYRAINALYNLYRSIDEDFETSVEE